MASAQGFVVKSETVPNITLAQLEKYMESEWPANRKIEGGFEVDLSGLDKMRFKEEKGGITLSLITTGDMTRARRASGNYIAYEGTLQDLKNGCKRAPDSPELFARAAEMNGIPVPIRNSDGDIMAIPRRMA